ncbi:bestrophin-like domain [Rhodoblastus sp.]|uniref:bestrophin-like domain n=1 Tax=Rhodoblastus sp. TaxID=1962975 RepID=UPI003F9A1BBF
MSPLLDHPLWLFAVSLLSLWLIAFGGYVAQRIWRPLRREERDEFNTVQGATLTLLALIVGFTFAMSVNRYDLRKNLEESEANAIGTEFVRAQLLPPASRAGLEKALRAYLDRRIAFYSSTEPSEIARLAREEARLQSDIWAIVRDAAAVQPTPVVALAVAGANDVLNAQGYVAAAWANRIPVAAWQLMALIAAACSGLLGFGGQRVNAFLLLVVPATISVSFLLIAEIDSPRGGLIRVEPANLVSLAESLK